MAAPTLQAAGPARELACVACCPPLTTVTGPVVEAGRGQTVAGSLRDAGVAGNPPVDADHPGITGAGPFVPDDGGDPVEFVRCGGREGLVPPGPLDVRFRSAA